MLEFIFFHKIPTDLFVEWLQQQGIDPEIQQEDETYTVIMAEEMEDDLYNSIEEKYELLFDMNEDIMKEEMGDEGDVHTANIAVTLRDGRVSYADVDPKLLGRVIGVITPEELSTIVKAIVDAVENPQEKTCCQLQAERNLKKTVN